MEPLLFRGGGTLSSDSGRTVVILLAGGREGGCSSTIRPWWRRAGAALDVHGSQLPLLVRFTLPHSHALKASVICIRRTLSGRLLSLWSAGEGGGRGQGFWPAVPEEQPPLLRADVDPECKVPEMDKRLSLVCKWVIDCSV